MDYLGEIRKRNVVQRMNEEIGEWKQMSGGNDSQIVFISHESEHQFLNFTIGINGVPFTVSYANEPYVLSCKDPEMSTWVSESNHYASEQNNLIRSLKKADIVYSLYFPTPELKQILQVKLGHILAQVEKIKEINPPYIPQDLYDAALGCLLGGFVGEASGATLEMLHRAPTDQEVLNALAMSGGGFHCVSPGQLTDDGELTLAVAHVLLDNPTLNKLAKKFVDWLTSEPFDIGGTIFRAIGCHNVYQWKTKIREQGLGLTVTECATQRNAQSFSNGSLMRAASLAIWGYKLPLEELRELSFLETGLTHPNPVVKQAVFCYRFAIVHLLNNLGDFTGAFTRVEDWAKNYADPVVQTWLEAAKDNKGPPYHPETGHIKIGFVHSFRHLLLQTDYYDALKETLQGGGDSDTNGIIVGALLGACYGIYRIPETMRQIVLECTINQKGKKKPRPEWMLAGQTPLLVKKLLETAPEKVDFNLINS